MYRGDRHPNVQVSQQETTRVACTHITLLRILNRVEDSIRKNNQKTREYKQLGGKSICGEKVGSYLYMAATRAVELWKA